MSQGMPARLPLSTSAFLTQSFSVFGEHPIFAAIDVIACQREPCWPSPSRTIRTARSRTSGENLFVVLIMMLHPCVFKVGHTENAGGTPFHPGEGDPAE